MPIRAHVGCGSVYLTDGWINVDVVAPNIHLAGERPDLVESLGTPSTAYYAKHEDKTVETLRENAATKDLHTVCDRYGTFDNLPFLTGEVDEILARQCFEHLSATEARRALDECDRVLKPGGLLRLDVPDHEGTLCKWADTGDPFFKRHLLGSGRNAWGFHLQSYTRDRLQKLVEEHGFVFDGEEDDLHFYPAFTQRFVKPPGRKAWDYALKHAGITIHDGAKVLDIGPGSNPFPRADAYVDIDEGNAKRIEEETGKPCRVASVEDCLPFADKQWDFVLAAHVVEHCQDPVKALAEISRVGKAGVVVVPHAFKDALFQFEEGDHKYWCFAPPHPGEPIGFMPVNYETRSKLSNPNMSAVMCRLLRTGPNRLENDSRVARKWFHHTEPNLDVIVAWTGSIEGRIISW